MAITIHKPQNTKDDTFLIRIANEDNETVTLHQSLKNAREPRAVLKTVIKVGARNM